MPKVKRKLRASLVRYAKEIGAWRNGKPDLYALIEHLAQIAKPKLFAVRSAGRPKGDHQSLRVDVNEVRRQKRCSIFEACEHLSDGYHPHQTVLIMADGRQVPVRAALGKWKGKKPQTLEQRFYQAMSEAFPSQKK
jgi:hypothetical protein